MVISTYGGSSLAVNFEGEKDYIERGFNGLVNHGASPGVSKYFEFKYLVTNPGKLERALKREGETLSLTRSWREFRVSGREVMSATEDEEAEFMAKAEKFGAQYAAEKLSQAVRENFMESITTARNSTFSSVEY